MARGLPIEISRQIVDAVRSGRRAEDVARDLGVSIRVVYKYVRLARKAGDAGTLSFRRPRKMKLDDDRERIQQLLQENPALTQRELKAILGLDVPLCTISRTLRRWKRRDESHVNDNSSSSESSAPELGESDQRAS
ncbi:MAG: hypothetical protein JNL58_13120 [Planctomyces sp.]|nr:hypothetical protein [Planctomyces sp.]